MGDSTQEALTFAEGLQAAFDRAGRDLLTITRRVIRASEMKQGDEFALALGISGSHLSEALSGKGQKHFALPWLPRVWHADKEDEWLNYAASLKGKKLVPIAPLTAEQKLELLRTELREGGANVEALETRAYARRQS